MSQLTGLRIYLAIMDSAQATIDIEPDRIYFALTTDDTMDSGSVSSDTRLMEAAAATLTRKPERGLPADTVMKVAFDYSDGSRRKAESAEFGADNLNSLISTLCRHSEHLEFLSGFAVR
ncbi:MAG: hypothetical protein J6C91_03615 [Muribaculaceae bacterium]|nr:hypothetical protein [Muribaculaceae bacterium]